MRIALAICAFGAIMTSFATPLNMSTTISPFTGDISLHKHPSGPRHVPISKTKCMGNDLSQEHYLSAKEKMIRFSESGGHINGGTWHSTRDPIDWMDPTGVTWYVCNCKFLHPDKVPRWELDDVQQVLEAKCSAWKSGLVYSKKWKKSYAVVPSRWYNSTRAAGKVVCPSHCMGGWAPN